MSAPRTLPLVDTSTGTVLSHGVVIDLHTAGAGPAILVLHGVEGPEANKAMVEDLARDHTVYVPTHPGFGLSPMPNWFRSVDDLAYLYLDLMARLDLTDVHLVGLQFGGWIAAEMAIRDCSRLKEITLVNPVGIKVADRTTREIADVFAMERKDLNAARFADPAKNPLPDLRTADPEDVLHLARNEEALATYAWEPYMHAPNLSRWLSRISVPTHVIHGDRDRIVGHDYAQAFCDFLPRSSFTTVEGAAHCAQIDRPDAVASLIRG